MEDTVLLGMKKRGFGEGKWNGFGGKVAEGEDSRMAAVRELEEESALVAQAGDLTQVGLIRFYFDNVPTIACAVYLLSSWEGEPIETDEMRPEWFSINDLPYNAMWAADREWVPMILSGRTISADVYFSADGSVVEKSMYTDTAFV